MGIRTPYTGRVPRVSTTAVFRLVLAGSLRVMDEIALLPANEAGCEDLQTVFGTRGAGAYCQCQRYKLQPKEAFSKFPVEERARRLREQTHCGEAGAETTSGLVAYVDGEPVGWVAVEPRPAYIGLLRAYRVPWEGREEDRTDDTVWAVTCLFVRAGYRGRGIIHALAQAAVDHARRRGARALEAYPLITQPGQVIAWDEIHVGTRSIFAAAGLTEIIQPTIRRVVMRIDFRDGVRRP
jgi:GNAT superfamily N-acetyltransferase